MSPQNRSILAKLLIGFLLAYGVLVVIYWHQSRAYAVSEAEKLVQDALLTHRGIHKYVATIQRPEIYRLQREGLLYEDYFQPEVLSFTFIARTIKELVNEERVNAGQEPVYFKLASDNPRNPVNQADPWEERLLERFNSETIEKFSEIYQDDGGEDHLYFAMPVAPNSAACMKCHGDPKRAPAELIERYGDKAGFWEDRDRIRALISIRVPLSAYLDNAIRVFGVLSAVTLLVLLVIFATVFYFIRRIDQQQRQLVQSEKMASLGRLVAGFAHEVNTPIGVAVGATTHACEGNAELRGMLEQDEVDEEKLVTAINSVNDACNLAYTNLARAAEMVRGFKQISIDQTYGELRSFNVAENVRDVIATLHPIFQEREIKLSLEIPPQLEIHATVGAFDHVVAQLISNSVLHGFADDRVVDPEISLRVEAIGYELLLDYRDNGSGLSEEMRARLFEPFSTTARGRGGSGLGMFTAYNVVVSDLDGEITLLPPVAGERGVHFTLRFPFIAPPLPDNAAVCPV